jgi:hypothetical protein
LADERHGAHDTATETHHEPHGAASPHGAADDVPGHEPADGDAGGHDEHGEALGPIDVMAWGAGALGILLGLVVVACMVLATSTLPAA